MARQRFCKVCRNWHDLSEPWPLECSKLTTARSDIPAPAIIGDNLETPLQSMANGKYYTSKSSLRQSYLPSGNKAGIRYSEVGNDASAVAPKPRKPIVPSKEDIMPSVAKALSRTGIST